MIRPLSIWGEAYLLDKYFTYICKDINDNMKDTKLKYEYGYPLRYQNMKESKMVSVILIVLVFLLYVSPFIYRNSSLNQIFSTETFTLFIFTLVIVLSLYQMRFIYKYLYNFYHPRSNIFMNLKWLIVAVVIIALLLLAGMILDQYNTTRQESSISLSDIYRQGDMQVIISLLLATYVLWVFTQVLSGWMLIDTRDVDFVGGLPILGYALFISAIIPLFIILVPLCSYNLISKAKGYSERHGFLNSF